MFEDLILLADDSEGIRLETHRRNPVKNTIARPPGEREKRLYELARKKHGQNWVNRKPACGIYNCFGMVFASRRTAIYEDDQVELVRRDDGYRDIPEGQARVGDLVVYRIADPPRTIIHIAQLVSCPRIDTRDLPIRALSKWNDSFGEDEHHVQHHLWKESDILVEYWTERED